MFEFYNENVVIYCCDLKKISKSNIERKRYKVHCVIVINRSPPRKTPGVPQEAPPCQSPADHPALIWAVFPEYLACSGLRPPSRRSVALGFRLLAYP